MKTFIHPFRDEISINQHSKFLILGSFPSEESKEFGFFYGNKRNQFWKILADLFCKNQEEKDRLIQRDKVKCKEFCQENGIVLWDIVESFESEEWPSTDSKLFRAKNIQYSTDRIYQILQTHPNLSIFGTSREVIKRYEKKILGCNNAREQHKQSFLCNYPIKYLPSPSPRYAKMKYDQKLNQWREALKVKELNQSQL